MKTFKPRLPMSIPLTQKERTISLDKIYKTNEQGEFVCICSHSIKSHGIGGNCRALLKSGKQCKCENYITDFV